MVVFFLLSFRSVNEVICHGIPDLRPLANGDILNSEHSDVYLALSTPGCTIRHFPLTIILYL